MQSASQSAKTTHGLGGGGDGGDGDGGGLGSGIGTASVADWASEKAAAE